MNQIEFGSVCSGIEAASVAWEPLGWRAAWLSEIEPFPSEVLKIRVPHAPNLGDMTTLPKRISSREVKAPDVLTGGTPCQAFSVAGRREGLADPRGNLSMTFVEIADAIDDVRSIDGLDGCIVVWENVPGVLSSRDNAFGCFLGALAGEGCELQPAGGRWTDAGCVYGPARAIAWRVIDAQFFGLAQRRRRVFVVASSRIGFDPARILFEFDGVRRDSAPSREEGKDFAAGTLRSSDGGSDVDHARAGHLISSTGDIAHCLNAGGMGRQDYETETMIVSPVAFSCKDHGGDAGDAGDVAPTLRAMGHGETHANAGGQVAVAFQTRGSNLDIGDVAGTIGTNADRASGSAPMVAFHPTQDPISSMDAVGCGSTHGQASIAVAVALRGREGGATAEVGDDCAFTLRASSGGGDKPHAMTGMAVRRLTPRECERLQGFPDDWTLIPVKARKKITSDRFAYLRASYPGLTAENALLLARDGPRYKAIGNSWAVTCARWVGRRIQLFLDGDL